jgi:hypothetical protein
MKLRILFVILINALFGFSASASPECGIAQPAIHYATSDAPRCTQTIDERIKSCAAFPGSSKTTTSGVTWNLVSRSDSKGNLMEVWRDSESGLIWSDTLKKDPGSIDYNHYGAIRMANGKVVEETACLSDEGKNASAHICERSFGLPTLADFQSAERHGMREVLPNINDRIFWSATLPYSRYAYSISTFNVALPRIEYRGSWYNDVRCVGR